MADAAPNKDEVGLRRAQKFMRQGHADEQLINLWLTDKAAFEALIHKAAALAIEAGQHGAAEQLICRALTGNPPTEIAKELRCLMENSHP